MHYAVEWPLCTYYRIGLLLQINLHVGKLLVTLVEKQLV